MDSDIMSQSVVEEELALKTLQDQKHDRMYGNDFGIQPGAATILPNAAGKGMTNMGAVEDIDGSSVVEPPEGHIQHSAVQMYRRSDDFDQRHEMDIADSNTYGDHSWNSLNLHQDSYQLPELFAPESHPLLDADSMHHQMPVSPSHSLPQTMNSSETVSKLLTEDVVMSRITQPLPQKNPLRCSQDDTSLPRGDFDWASSSTAVTPSLVRSSHPPTQSNSASPSLSQSAPTHNLPLASAPNPPLQIPRKQAKFYIAVPELPPGVTKEDYSWKPIRSSRQSAISYNPESNNANPGDKAGPGRRRIPNKRGSSIASSAPKKSSSKVPISVTPNRSFPSDHDVDSIQYYEEYVSPSPLLELDPSMLESRPPASLFATVLATRHLRNSWAQSRHPFLAHTMDNSREPGFSRLSDHNEENTAFADKSSRHTSSALYAHDASVMPDPTFALPDGPSNPSMSPAPFPFRTTFHEQLPQPINGNYFSGHDDAFFGDRSFDQHWISSASTFNESFSYVVDGTVDPSLLGGIQEPRSPSPTQCVSTSYSTASVERQSSSRPSRTVSKRGSSLLFSSQVYDSDSEPSLFKLDKDDSMYYPSQKQRPEKGLNGRGRGRGKNGSRRTVPQVASSDVSDLVSETIVQTRRSGTTRQRLDDIVADHSSMVPATEKKMEYCHQCRNASVSEKMTCTKMLEFEVPCRKKYCVGCIVKRYPDIEFVPFATMFVCPSCENTCNCTACCAKRGESYISTRHVKVDKETLDLIGSGIGPRTLPSASAEFVRMSKEINKSSSESHSNEKSHNLTTDRTLRKERQSKAGQKQGREDSTTGIVDRMQTSRLIEEYSGPSGAYWGAVFSVSGDRIGSGFVGESGTEIVLKPAQVVRKLKKRTYVGQLQECWGLCDSDEELNPDEPMVSTKVKGKGKGRAQDRKEYVGDRSMLFRHKGRSQRETSLRRDPYTHFGFTPVEAVPFDPEDYSEADAEGEDDDEQERSHWIIIESSSPVRPPVESLKTMSQEQVQIAMQRAINAVQAG